MLAIWDFNNLSQKISRCMLEKKEVQFSGDGWLNGEKPIESLLVIMKSGGKPERLTSLSTSAVGIRYTFTLLIKRRL